MKTAICYYSNHHGNTRKVVEAMAQTGDVTLIDAAGLEDISLTDYDCIGFASGIYAGRFHASVLRLARQALPEGLPVFFVCTYSFRRSAYTHSIREIAEEKGCPVLGEFGCRGYNTFGPFKLVGGVAKGHPNNEDLSRAQAFYRRLAAKEQ